MSNNNNSPVPKVSIVIGEKNTGIHIFREHGGIFTGTPNKHNIGEVLKLLEAVVDDLTEYKDELKAMNKILEEGKVKPIDYGRN